LGSPAPIESIKAISVAKLIGGAHRGLRSSASVKTAWLKPIYKDGHWYLKVEAEATATVEARAEVKAGGQTFYCQTTFPLYAFGLSKPKAEGIVNDFMWPYIIVKNQKGPFFTPQVGVKLSFQLENLNLGQPEKPNPKKPQPRAGGQTEASSDNRPLSQAGDQTEASSDNRPFSQAEDLAGKPTLRLTEKGLNLGPKILAFDQGQTLAVASDETGSFDLLLSADPALKYLGPIGGKEIVLAADLGDSLVSFTFRAGRQQIPKSHRKEALAILALTTAATGGLTAFFRKRDDGYLV
jgi:hypothetical protein